MGFTREQVEAVQKKINLLSPLAREGISQDEFVQEAKKIEYIITAKRLAWYEEIKDGEHSHYLRDPGISDIQKAFWLIYGYKMRISKEYLEHSNIYAPIDFTDTGDGTSNLNTSIAIQAKNFCPYLEAFRIMGFDANNSTWLCKNVLEKPCEVLAQKINPDIMFFRDYGKIRPLTDYCIEGMVHKSYLGKLGRNFQNEQMNSVNYSCSDDSMLEFAQEHFAMINMMADEFVRTGQILRPPELVFNEKYRNIKTA